MLLIGNIIATSAALLPLAMASEESKVPEWTVVYHSGNFKGRGEYLRLMLEDADVPYQNLGDNLFGATGMMDAFRGSPEAAAKEDDHFPVFFPPAIWHRPADGEEVLVNQVGACLIYIGDQLGYAPKSAAEKARANSILLNALDYVSEGRSSFHPVKNSMSYKDQKEEGDKVSKEFSQLRMKLFLHHFNKVVKKNADPKKPIAGGSGITYADFALFYALDATASQFNSEHYEHAWDNTAVPELKAYYEWIKARPKLQAYFQSDRCKRKQSYAPFSPTGSSCHSHEPFSHTTGFSLFAFSFCRRQHDVNLLPTTTAL